MNVVWADRALKTLAKIHSKLTEDSPEVANRIIDEILKRGDQIASFPYSGRKVTFYNRNDIRELIEGKYRIIYRVRQERIEIINIFHTSQQPPWKK
jgi:toxin ParE1/3/4